MVDSNIWLNILQSSPLPTAVFSISESSNNLVFANKAYYELLGIREGAIIKKSAADIFSSKNIDVNVDFIAGLELSFKNVFESGIANKMPISKLGIRYQDSDVAVTVYIDFEHSPIEKGGVVKYVSQSLIKQEKAPEISFQTTDTINGELNRAELIETILQNLPIGIAVNKIDSGEATFINNQFSETYGWSEKELVDTKSFFDKVYPDPVYRAKILKMVIDDINSGEVSRMEWDNIEVTTATGEKRIIKAKNIPLFDQNLMISTVIDITLQARQAAEIRNTKANQDALINSSDDLMWSVNTECKIITANKAFLKSLKHTTGRDLQKGDSVLDDVFGDEINRKWLAYYDRTIAGDNFISKEEYFNPLKNRIDYLVVSFSPMRNDQGEIFGAACYSKDITDDTLALIALQKARNETHKIMESSLDVICTVDANGCFVNVSAAATKIWGYHPEELVGKRYMNLVYVEDRALTIETSRDIMGGTETTNFENRYVKKDGSLVTILWSARWDNTDQIMYCIARDATEMKLAENRLLQSQKRYRSLVENGADSLVILDITGRATYVSPSVTRILGYSEEEIVEMDINSLFHPDDREEAILKREESIRKPGETIIGCTSRIRHKNGSWRWIEASLTNMLHDPMINGIVDNFRDITERVETELEKNLLISNTEESFVLLNMDLEIVTFNDQFFKLYKNFFSKVVEKGKSILTYAQPERRPIVAGIYKRVLLGETENSEMDVVDPSTIEKRTFSINFKPAKNSSGEIIGAFVTAADITDRKLVLKKLTDSEESYKLLFQSSPLPNFVYDLADFQILDVNDSATEQYGFSRSELLSMSILDITVEHERKKIIELHKQSQFTDRAVNFGIFAQFKKNGDLIQSNISGYKINFGGQHCMLIACNDVTEKERAFQRIKENESKLLASQKIAKVGYWQSFPGSKELYWSDEVYNIWELDKKAFNLDYDTYFNTIHPDDREEFLRSREKAFEKGLEYDLEHRIILTDGSIKWVHALGNLIKDEQGEIKVFEGTVQDITKDKLILEKLLISEARHRSIFDSQTNYMIRTDLDGNYSFVNNKFLQDFGWLYEGEEILGQNGMTSILEHHRERVAETVNKCFAKLNEVFQVFIDKPRKDGIGVVTTVWDFICLTDSKGQPNEIQCVGIDVSEWKRAQEELEESNARYEYVTRATSDAIWDWDLRTDEMYRGSGFQTLFGYSYEKVESRGTFLKEHIHPEDINDVLRSIETIINGNQETWILEYRLRKFNGKFAFVQDKGILIRDKSGTPIKMVGAMQDISESKIAEKQKLLHAETSMLFNQPEAQLNDILERVLKHILDFGDIAIAEIWLLSSDKQQIILSSRSTRGANFDVFYEETFDIKRFVPGTGLPGKVWESREVQLWDAIDKDPKFIRHTAAKIAALKTAVGLPLVYNDEFIGVFVLFHQGGGESLLEHVAFRAGFCQHLSSEIKRKQLDQELKQIFSFAPDVISVIGTDGFFKKINPAACEMLEYSEEELLLQPVKDFIHPEDQHKTRQVVRSFITNTDTFYFENRYITKSGKVIWLAWTSTPSPEEDLMFAVAKNITEKKNLEVLLEKSNSLAEIGSWEIDIQNNSLYWSTVTKQIHETDTDFEPDIDTAINFYTEGYSRDSIRNAVEESQKNGTAWDMELQIVTAIGNQRWVRTLGEAEFVNGSCVKLYGSFQNITHRKVAEIELLKIYEEKNTILESIQDGFFALDKNWIVTYWNHEAQNLTLLKRSEILNKNLWDVFEVALDLKFYSEFHKAVNENVPVRFEEYFAPLNRWFEASAFPSDDGLTVYFRHISNRKSIEFELSQFKKIIDNSKDGIAIADIEGKITYLNPAFSIRSFTTARRLSMPTGNL
ncbi:PAS domain S-box protein [Daejeonella sp.]|uniref:PAS domain S-box protein n=1 Tax=Daejeonella sp. TaxID=2805397 RepID=UPI00398327EC